MVDYGEGFEGDVWGDDVWLRDCEVLLLLVVIVVGLLLLLVVLGLEEL